MKKKYYDAKHNCYAYITINNEEGIIKKCSDDGEPSGTAGSPILAILEGNKLCNILVIVTRYFGGILLGTGGLVRAYQDATLKALNNTKYVILEKGKNVRLIMEYSEIENIRYYCRKNNINIIEEEYSDNVEFIIEITNKKLEELYKNIYNMSIKMTKIDILKDKNIKTNITE